MAVRRVVAAIDVVINGQRNIDRLANSYVAAERTVQSAQRTLTQFGKTTTSVHQGVQLLTGSVRGLATGFGSFVNSIVRGRNALEQQGQATRGLRDNIVTLTRSMLMFSVLLPLVQLPQRAVESLGEFVRVGALWQDQLRVTNTLLNLGEVELRAYSDQIQQMAGRYGLATDAVKALMTTAASSVSAIKDNAAQLQLMGRAAYDASTALELATASARLAYATGTQATEATTTLIQVMATYGLEVEHLAAVSDSLFAITDIGTIKFSELEHVLPRVTAAMGPMIQRYTTAEEKMTVMNESFAAFAAMTQVMSPEQAATSFSNIFKDIAQMTGKQKDLVQSWERIRKTNPATAGMEMSLLPEELLKGGPMGALVQLRRIFELRGAMVDAYVANQRRMGSTANEDALRVAGQSQLMQAYFEDVRAVRGFQSTSVEQLVTAQRQYEEGRAGAVGRGEAQMDRSFLQQQAKLRANLVGLQTALFQTLEQPLVTGMNPINQMFVNLLGDADFKAAGFLPKLRIFANTLMDQFTNYFRSGGREQIQTVGREIGGFIGESVTAFFRGGKDNVLVEAGRAFSEAFISGIGQTLPEMLGAILRSSITKAVAEMIAIRYITRGRMPDAASRALAVGGTAALEMGTGGEGVGGGIANFALPAAGAAILLGAGAAAMMRGARTPIFGKAGIRSPAGTVRSVADIGLLTSIMANWRNQNPAFATGALNTPVATRGAGWPGFSRIARMGGGVGGSALLGGLMAIPAMLAAENEREAWSAAGGGVGSILGGVGGGLAGLLTSGGLLSAALGIGGSMAGGFAGGAAGGALYDLFHPATGAGGIANAEAPERLAMAEVFATGVDASLAIPLLTQIRDLLIRSGGGSIGGFSTPAGTTATQDVTGRGLQASFVDQINTTELTNAQAQAACGPAAAAFFARAYGRNPTLKEAYQIVSQVQGGDPASVGGTRGVGTLGLALNKMGVQSEVYSGPNIDWGRLAENAEAGIPGIVNIGPRGNFPGHYFQIGGYDRATNAFNVGVSGTTLRGGKAMMTPEEMMALGPKQGAIYGLGKTGATGAGNLTEADIAAIPSSAATGMGPGGAGGAVTIHIQNMMNVEHMDGSTDIRALMGQMADVLRQLSTGGSVVGQSGTVTP